MITNPRQFEEPLFISRDELKNRQTTPAVDLNAGNAFENIRRTGEQLKSLEVPFLPKTSSLRYLPGELAGETFKASTPQTPIEAGLMVIPFGTLAKPLAKTPIGKLATKEIGKGLEKVVPRIFKGFKDLTTKFLEYAKGKTALSKQEIMDFAKRPELKKGEADLLLKKLEEFEPKAIPAEKGIIPQLTPELRKRVESVVDLKAYINDKTYLGRGIEIHEATELPIYDKTPKVGLKTLIPPGHKEALQAEFNYYRSVVPELKNYSDKEIDRVVIGRLHEKYGKYKYGNEMTNPIEFKPKNPRETELYNIIREKLDIKPTQAVKGVGEISNRVPAQEFADSLRRDLLELKPVKVKEPQYQMMGIDRQQGRMIVKGDETKMGKNYEEVVFESPITTNGSSHYPNSKNYFAHARGDEVAESGKKIWREQEIQSDALQKEGLENLFGTETYKMINEGKSAQEIRKSMGNWNPNTTVQDIQTEIDKIKSLSPFTNDRFGERIMRERIKEKARQGYQSYRLPTGETIGKIEGFEGGWTTQAGEKALPENVNIGDTILMGGHDPYLVTKILPNGQVKAINEVNFPQAVYAVRPDDFAKPVRGSDDWATLQASKNDIENYAETFDLTGKSNPQYRRYEDWGKFLKNKYGGKEIVDTNGNSWMEIDLRPEMGKAPVEAFGIGAGLLGAEQQQEDNKQRIQFLHK